jgi:hypothetical protein
MEMLDRYRKSVVCDIENVELASIGIAKGIIVWKLAGKTTPATAFELGLKRSFVIFRYCSI